MISRTTIGEAIDSTCTPSAPDARNRLAANAVTSAATASASGCVSTVTVTLACTLACRLPAATSMSICDTSTFRRAASFASKEARSKVSTLPLSVSAKRTL